MNIDIEDIESILTYFLFQVVFVTVINNLNPFKQATQAEALNMND